MEEADRRLAKHEQQQRIERGQQIQEKLEQAEIYRIVRTEREESERNRLLKLEYQQNEKAELALESKQKQVYRKVLKTMIREEISYNLTKENKQRIDERETLMKEQTMKRYNSAQLRSQSIREMNMQKDFDTEKFERQRGNVHQL